jgi:hypothetical protein
MGAIGHLLLFGQGRFLNHVDIVENITLFGRHVAPRLRELTVETQQAGVAAAE